MRFVREIASLNELDIVAGEILEKASDYKIFCFQR